MKLSGGERQRVAIARAFLKDAPILILDEATANLDAETEAEVVDQLRAFARDKTLVVISHRPAALELADRVMTLGTAERRRARTRGLYARSFATMKEAPSMARGILERLAEGPVLGDGGYLLELEKRGYVQAGPFTPEVVIEHPDALAQLHREFLRAGAEVLQTMTFYASDDKLATVGLAGKVDEINRTAVAHRARGRHRGRRARRGQPLAHLGLRPRGRRRAPTTSARCFDRQLQDQTRRGTARLLDRRDVLATSARRSCSSSARRRPACR